MTDPRPMKRIDLRGYVPTSKPRHKRLSGARCVVCHVRATHVEKTDKPTLLVRPDGLYRMATPEALYYCDDHTGVTT